MQAYQLLYAKNGYQIISRNNGGSGKVEVWKINENGGYNIVCTYDKLNDAIVYVNDN